MFEKIAVDRGWRLIAPEPLARPYDPLLELADALDEAIDCEPVRDMFGKDSRVLVLVSDSTRDFPKGLMFMALREHLSHVPDENIEILVACGIHRPLDVADLGFSPEVLERYRVGYHDPTDFLSLAYIGTTRPKLVRYSLGLVSLPYAKLAFSPRLSAYLNHALLLGTPIWINRKLLEFDAVIAIGQIRPHYFFGFSGGAKSLLPGACGTITAEINHALRVFPTSRFGFVRGNPAREDAEEAAEMFGRLFVFNSILDATGGICSAVFGRGMKAFMWGCERAKEAGRTKIERFDMVAVEAKGGMGTDLVQAQKALAIAGYFAKEGGVILLGAPCTNGIGDVAKARTVFDFTVSRYIPDGVRILLLAPAGIRDIRGLPFELVHSPDEAVRWTRTITRGEPEVGYIPDASIVWPEV